MEDFAMKPLQRIQPVGLVLAIACLVVLSSAPAVAQEAAASPSPAPMQQALGRTDGDDADRSQRAAPSPSPSPAASPSAGMAFLGILVKPVPDALRAHLGSLLTAKTGALVDAVQDGSPAASGGIQRYDIIADVDGTRVDGPGHVVKLIRERKPGDRPTIGVIRSGQRRELQVALGTSPQAPAAAFDELRHLKISKDDQDRLTVELRFEDQAGKTVERRYEGTRAEIDKQISQDPQLTDARRRYVIDNLRGMTRSGMDMMERGLWHFGESPEHRRLREQFRSLIEETDM